MSTPNPWLYAGLASSFPNIEPADANSKSKKTKIASSAASDEDLLPPCKVLQLSTEPGEQPQIFTPKEAQKHAGALDLQLLIFRYRDKMHAMNHSCPHQSYPLSHGSLYDIEDFGIVLSAGVACPKHGWTFDLFTGQSDRGGYKLALWEVEVRDGDSDGDEQVWVRRKEKKRVG